MPLDKKHTVGIHTVMPLDKVVGIHRYAVKPASRNESKS